MAEGRPWPLGVEWIESEHACNFAIYSRHATGVTLLCYADGDSLDPVASFPVRAPTTQDREYLASAVPGFIAARRPVRRRGPAGHGQLTLAAPRLRDPGSRSGWRRVVDTACASPDDIVEPGAEPHVETASYRIAARS